LVKEAQLVERMSREITNILQHDHLKAFAALTNCVVGTRFGKQQINPSIKL
jgi:hypothetical protein